MPKQAEHRAARLSMEQQLRTGALAANARARAEDARAQAAQARIARAPSISRPPRLC